MRVFLTVLILIFSLQSWTKADDIRDFQIEGMSLGDSLLNFISEEKIKINTKDWYKKKGFKPVVIDGSYFDSELYDSIEFTIKTNDNKYIIYMVAGIEYPKDINNCYKKQKEIFAQLYPMFGEVSGIKIEEITEYIHGADPSGKSTFTRGRYIFESGDSISVDCNDFTEETNYPDEMYVAIDSKEFYDWIMTGESAY